MKRIAIYPFVKQVLNNDLYLQLRLKYDEVVVLSEDASLVNSYKAQASLIGFKLEVYEPKILTEFNAVYLLNSIEDENPTVYEGIIQACEVAQVKIIYNNKISNSTTSVATKSIAEDARLKKLYRINAPVISIYSCGVKCENEIIALKLFCYFNDKGYNVKILSEGLFETLLGYAQYPQSMRYDRYTFEQKVLKLNNYIRQIVRDEKVDLLIVDVPDPIMKFDNSNTNNFGLIPFLVSHAIEPDISICSIYYNEYDDAFFEKMSFLCQYRFNNRAKYFNMSQTAIRYSEIGKKIEYVTASSKDISIAIDDCQHNPEYTLFNVSNESTMKNVLVKIEEELLSNIPVI